MASSDPAATVSCDDACRQVGVAGIEGQGQLGMIELGEQLGQVGHPAAGMDARRHVLDADR